MLKVKKDSVYLALREAFTFQLEAVDSIKDLTYAGVFHEQGLGKTKIAIDLILYWLTQEHVDSVIIVTKKSLVPNWQREFKIHTHINPRILNQDKNNNFAALNSPARVYLTHYEVLNSEENRILLFQKTRKVGIVLDESQKIKNPAARLTQSALYLAPGFVRRLILTGTPIANRPYDIWSQIYFLDHGESLGSDFDGFKSMLDLDKTLSHSESRQADFEHSLQKLSSSISGFTVRETKDKGIIQLPNKEIFNVSCDWETIQQEMYKTFRDEMRSVVVQEGIPTTDDSEALLKRLLRLTQIASNPALVDTSYSQTPGKIPYLLDLVEQIIRNKEKAIIWTSFTQNADWLAQNLRQYGAVKVHGKMAMPDRNRSILHFLDKPEKKLLIATPGAAKEGFTLTIANHVIFYDRSFSLDDYLQAQDRIHRISQVKACFVHNLIMPDSIDEWTDVLLKAKHLAAQLGQGDISKEEYASKATYDFPMVLIRILNIDRDTESEE